MGFVLEGLGLGMQYKASQQQAKAAKEAGDRALIAAEAEAKQLETRAKQEVAVGSYNSALVKKRAQEILATQRAVAAAGGGDTTDVTVQAISDDTIKQAAIEQLMVMGEAEDRARQDRYAASVARYTGASQYKSARMEAKAYRMAGTATLLGGTGKMMTDGGFGWDWAMGK